MKKLVALLLAAVMLLALTACGEKTETAAPADSGSASSSASSSGAKLRFVTGGESGTYYAFGSVIAQHATNNAGVNVVGLVGNGSQANVMELQDGNAELAFCQSDVMAYAYNGTNLFEETGKVDASPLSPRSTWSRCRSSRPTLPSRPSRTLRASASPLALPVPASTSTPSTSSVLMA